MSHTPCIEARISWIGYIKLTLIGILLYSSIIAAIISSISAGVAMLFDNRQLAGVLFAIMSFICLGFLIYGFIRIRSCRVYTDNEGVWYEGGLFPWSRGTTGVRWENFDQVLFRKSFFSWITGSYTVYLDDRYGRSITVKNIWLGRRWVGQVNHYAMNTR